jgi:hypothetical protein
VGHGPAEARLGRLALVLLASAATAGERAGKPPVRWEGGRTVVDVPGGGRLVVEPDAEQVGIQVGIQQVAVSADGEAIGWVTTIGGAGPSYPIPHVLLVYAGGGIHEVQPGMPVWAWEFQPGGKLLACYSNFTHGPDPGVYELRHVVTGELQERFVPGQRGAKKPAWVNHLEATHAAQRRARACLGPASTHATCPTDRH